MTFSRASLHTVYASDIQTRFNAAGLRAVKKIRLMWLYSLIDASRRACPAQRMKPRTYTRTLHTRFVRTRTPHKHVFGPSVLPCFRRCLFAALRVPHRFTWLLDPLFPPLVHVAGAVTSSVLMSSGARVAGCAVSQTFRHHCRQEPQFGVSRERAGSAPAQARGAAATCGVFRPPWYLPYPASHLRLRIFLPSICLCLATESLS